MIKAAAPKEFAPGIPKKRRIVKIPRVSKPVTWKFGLQFHDADRAGKHFDLRIGDPKGNAHSWALRRMPEPGEKVLATQQPTHTVDYMPFQGRVETTYGRGDVKSLRFESTEVVKSGPNQLTFHLHKGHQSEEYSLIKLKAGNAWLLVNHTATRKGKPNLPTSKPSYKEIPFEQVPSRIQSKPQEMMGAKIDGGHNTFELNAGKPLRIYSYRPTKRGTGLIEHTHRVPNAYTTRVPAGLGGTILRGELYARDLKTGKPLPSQTVGGMLNANVWLSRERQKVHGPLRAAIFDVVKWRGRNVEKAPYAKKMEILKAIKKQIPWLEIPDTATTLKQKANLLAAIKSGKHPQTREGVVFWDALKGTSPVKAKILQDHDVFIKGFEAGKGELKGKGVGAIQYGLTKNPKEVVGRVGTGLSRSLRTHMQQNPELYKGKLMKVKAQGQFPSGALRSPRFLQMHLDTLEGAEKVAAGPKVVGRERLQAAMKKRMAKTAGWKRFVARRLNREELQRIISQLPYDQGVLRARREYKRRRRHRLEKRGYGGGASGGGGFLEEPHGTAPISQLDSQGRLRTNDEPDVEIKNTLLIKTKRRKKSRYTKPMGSPRLHTGDRSRYQDEPYGVTRGFRANAENVAVS